MYLKTPLAPPIKNQYEVGYHNKKDRGLVTNDRIASTFLDKTLPLFCFPDKGFTMPVEDVVSLVESNRFPSVLTSFDSFSRDINTTSRIYIVVPIVLSSDISPFSVFFLRHDGKDYELYMEYSEEKAQSDYGVSLSNLYDAESTLGDIHHNPGILYLIHPYVPSRTETDPVGYNINGDTELWVKLGNKDDNVQEQLIGPAIRYVSTESGVLKNYAKVSLLDDSSNILGFKTVDIQTNGDANMFLRVSFTMPLAQDLPIDLSVLPVSLKDSELSDDLIEKLGITITQTDQFSITPSDAGDFGGSGSYVIPAGTREYTIPITLDSGAFAKACMYNVDFGDSDIVVVNNDLLILARNFDYTDQNYTDYGYEAKYKLTSVDGVVEYRSGTLYGKLDFSDEIQGAYMLEVELSNMDLAEYLLRSRNGVGTSTAKRDTFFACLNWCSHDILEGSVVNSTHYGERTRKLKYRVDIGSGSFKFVSLLPFLNGNSEPDNIVEITL